MHRSINMIAAVGLALGGALGLAGAMVTQQNVQAMLWAIDGAGLVMAAAMLAIKYFRTGNDVVAGGFLVFAIGEGVILLSGPGLAGSVAAFADFLSARTVTTKKGKFGYLRIWSFDVDDDDAFIEAATTLIGRLPERGLIIDLRRDASPELISHHVDAMGLSTLN